MIDAEKITLTALDAVRELINALAAAIARAEAAEAKWVAVQAYAAYYAEVTGQGDAPETFENWYGGAANWANEQGEAQP